MLATSSYDLRLDPATGHVTCDWQTDDNLDCGEPSEPAALHLDFRTLDEALTFTQGCHFGWRGDTVVLVTLDGDYIDRNGFPLSEEEIVHFTTDTSAISTFNSLYE